MVLKISTEPSEFRYEVNPETAAQMLDTNTRNRPISWARVRRYSSDMEKGFWRYNPSSALCFDTQGTLANGQHRLLAVLDSETTQEFLIATGVPVDTQDVMDSGMTRTPAQQLAIHGYQDAKHLATIARVYVKWENGTVTTQSTGPTTSEIRRWIDDAKPESLAFAVAQARRISAMTLLKAGPIGSAAYSAHIIVPGAAEEFFDLMASGAGMEQGHPVLTLSNYLKRQSIIGAHFPVHHQLWLLVSTWNTWRAGKSLHKIMSPSEFSVDRFPRVK